VNVGDLVTLSITPNARPEEYLFLQGFRLMDDPTDFVPQIIGAVQGLRALKVSGTWQIEMDIYVYSANPRYTGSSPYTQIYEVSYALFSLL
jgi:hypothetical protein